MRNNLGIIGIGVMGKNLSYNISNHGYKVSIFNKSKKKLDQVIKSNTNNRIFPFFSIEKFVLSLRIPRCIILMVPSGSTVDEVIDILIPYLSSRDLIVDGGNSHYIDTIKREKYLINKGIYFIGAGISGGESGALKGPSIMPGGSEIAYKYIVEIFEKISAKYNYEPCVTYIGPNGSGHYVKMVHNGIEYSDMQLISEVYFLIKNLLVIENQELSDIFLKWNDGELNSYLIEITGNILKKKDRFGKYILDLILDEASYKGTGQWTAQSALELKIPLSLITESVFVRYLSSLRSQRILASTILKGPKKNFLNNLEKEKFLKEIRKALFLSKLISYSQGFYQLKVASEKYKWNLKYVNIAKIFRSGCIIRASFLNEIVNMYSDDNNLINLLFTPFFKDIANKYQNSLRYIVSLSIKNGISVPVLSSSLSYYDYYRSRNSSANLIQAQRDYFGSHTYQRIDKEGFYHTNWS